MFCAYRQSCSLIISTVPRDTASRCYILTVISQQMPFWQGGRYKPCSRQLKPCLDGDKNWRRGGTLVAMEKVKSKDRPLEVGLGSDAISESPHHSPSRNRFLLVSFPGRFYEISRAYVCEQQ
jgi:hypothetical protein